MFRCKVVLGMLFFLFIWWLFLNILNLLSFLHVQNYYTTNLIKELKKIIIFYDDNNF